MSREIYCTKLKQKAMGLNAAPFPGELGEIIYESISQQVWEEWLGKQTMLVNEHKLSLASVDARKFLRAEMEKFLFT